MSHWPKEVVGMLDEPKTVKLVAPPLKSQLTWLDTPLFQEHRPPPELADRIATPLYWVKIPVPPFATR